MDAEQTVKVLTYGSTELEWDSTNERLARIAGGVVLSDLETDLKEFVVTIPPLDIATANNINGIFLPFDCDLVFADITVIKANIVTVADPVISLLLNDASTEVDTVTISSQNLGDTNPSGTISAGNSYSANQRCYVKVKTVADTSGRISGSLIFRRT